MHYSADKVGLFVYINILELFEMFNNCFGIQCNLTENIII